MDTQGSGNGRIGGTLSSSLIVHGGPDLFLPRIVQLDQWCTPLPHRSLLNP